MLQVPALQQDADAGQAGVVRAGRDQPRRAGRHRRAAQCFNYGARRRLALRRGLQRARAGAGPRQEVAAARRELQAHDRPHPQDARHPPGADEPVEGAGRSLPQRPQGARGGGAGLQGRRLRPARQRRDPGAVRGAGAAPGRLRAGSGRCVAPGAALDHAARARSPRRWPSWRPSGRTTTRRGSRPR